MRFTFNSPNECSHVHIHLSDGREFVFTMDSLIESAQEDGYGMPFVLYPVIAAVKNEGIETLAELKAEMEGKDY
jgi:hypothetical protein